ncbi:MAG: phosphomannomutase/phosphoglucomutase [Acidobacteria bacterium]|nr:phosphomannomutase/phosphoglucomutase [Acidobacteriota bacterium]
MNPHVFREYDIRGIVERDLTDDWVYNLGRACGTHYRRNGVSRVSLARDGRESSPHLRDLLSRGLMETGCDVVDIGMVPTPLLYFSLFTLGVGGGIMITGSHNPPEYNGFKVALGKTTVYGQEIQVLRHIMEADDFVTGERGSLTEQEIIPMYHQHVMSTLRLGPRRHKVVIDAGNGVGGFVAVPLYRQMGFEVIELYCEPDSTFPHHHPDPTVVENMQDLIATVRKEQADVGIAFDGDADRIGVVDEQGKIMWGDQLVIIFSREILKEQPGATFISEVKASQTLFDDVARHGGRPIMWKVGHSPIKAKMKEEHAAMAGEMSGHIFFADRYFGYDDAIYAGARLLEILSNADWRVSQLLEGVPPMMTTPEIRVECPDEKKFRVVEQLATDFKKDHQVIDIDGARILFDGGWGLVRASNTQPALVLRFEATDQERLQKIRSTVEEKVWQLMAA